MRISFIYYRFLETLLHSVQISEIVIFDCMMTASRLINYVLLCNSWKLGPRWTTLSTAIIQIHVREWIFFKISRDMSCAYEPIREDRPVFALLFVQKRKKRVRDRTLAKLSESRSLLRAKRSQNQRRLRDT